MMLQIILFLLLGVTAGTITGLIPGIHINLVGIFLVSIYSVIKINPSFLIIFITAMAITHTFIDFIPSIFLGCPDTDTELSILPGHELLNEGFGYEAIILSAYGGIAAIIILIIISIPSIFIIPKIYETMKVLTPGLLILASFFLISTEKNKTKAWIIFLLSGILGLFTLNYSGTKEPLLPLLTGLFGASMLIISIKNKTKIPDQQITKVKTSILQPVIGAMIASPICSFLPGMGSGQAAILGNTISKTDKKGFLVLLGATNTLVMGFSFIALYAVSKTRTGAAVAIKEITGILTKQEIVLILAITLIAGFISFLLTIFLARYFAKRIQKVNYKNLSILTLGILIMLIILISKLKGVGIFFLATLLGIYSISTKVKKTQMMGCLLIPTIILYLH